jgi:tetratricopeptide (TPR) repeat protein
MKWTPTKLPRSAPLVLIVLMVGAVAAFAVVSHLVRRFDANRQALGRKLFVQGVADANARSFSRAIDEFRAALSLDPANSQYQLSLARALRDSGDPRRLDEAESYLLTLWQRAPQDGTINLALGRVAAHRGSIEDAIRYYHNSIYGVWTNADDLNRRKARLELIEFLFENNARDKAQAELVALAGVLPPNLALHLEAAQLFAQARDYADALTQYEEALRLDRGNASAFAGAGSAAYQMGHYRTAQRYQQEAVSLNPQDTDSRQLLESAGLILQADPFRRRISDIERNRRIAAAFAQAEQRLISCAESRGIILGAKSEHNDSGNAASNTSAATNTQAQSPSGLSALQARWIDMKPKLSHLHAPGATDLHDAIMDLVFQIEQQTAKECGPPQGLDLALLSISRNREAADQ